MHLVRRGPAVFLAAALADLSTYSVTSVQLALAFPDVRSGVLGSVVKFLSIFSITQIPLAIGEGLVTVLVVRLLLRVSPAELDRLGLRSRGRRHVADRTEEVTG